MEYHKFIIRNYRAITGPLEIDVVKNSLLPIIGINESGKTTILHAIFSFDWYNDDLNDNGRHLSDISNLYRTSSSSATISAQIGITYKDFIKALNSIDFNEVEATDIDDYKNKKRGFPSSLIITRNLDTLQYNIENPRFSNKKLNNMIARSILGRLPYILFFDDFRDSVEERIQIVKSTTGNTTGWLAILEQLFKQTDPKFSVFNLDKLEDRNRKSTLAKVKRHLNTTLTKEWQNFRLDESDALQISIEFETQYDANKNQLNFLKLEIIETDANGDEHYFFIRDRSKGFFWFFNFVMKLEFNPKILSSNDVGTIYLLDEPGSYLHASAQSKLW